MLIEEKSPLHVSAKRPLTDEEKAKRRKNMEKRVKKPAINKKAKKEDNSDA